MPNFKYVVRDHGGKLIKGSIEKENQEAVVSYLKEEGLTPLSVSRLKPTLRFENFIAKFKKVNLAERNTFTRQLVTLIKAGLPLITSLDVLKKQTSDKLLKSAIQEVINDIRKGSSFSESLQKHSKCFDELYVNMIKAGEEGGILDETLERLADLGEHELKVRRDIKAATRYPIMVVVALIIGFVILIMFVLPRYAKIFAQFNTQLPLPTRILIQTHHLFQNYWLIIIPILLGLIVGFIRLINTKKGRKKWDALKLKIPVLGDLMLKLVMSRFTRTTAILMKTGIPILNLLDLVKPSVGNKVVEEAIVEIKKEVIKGKNLSQPIETNALFPPIVSQMVAIGEETGELDELLLKVSYYYDTQTAYIIDNLTTLIEPFLLLIMGSAVLFIALSVFLPMWNLMTLFR